MKDLIQRIVDIDREAQKLTEEAQQEQRNSTQDIEKQREQIRSKYMQEARARIAQEEPAQRAQAEEAWKKTKAHYDAVRERMEAQYRENGGRWVQQLVDRVLGA